MKKSEIKKIRKSLDKILNNDKALNTVAGKIEMFFVVKREG